MRILDRYLLRELLIPFGYCLGGFWIFWMAFDLFAEMAEFQRNGCTAGDLVQYYGLKTPEMLVMVVPIAFLLALLYALTDMARHQELTAMRAAGVGVWRISLPYLGVGLLLSVGVFFVNEFWVPESVEAAAALKHARRENISASVNRNWKRKLTFVNSRQRRKWVIEAYNVASTEMIRPYVEWILTTGTRVDMWADRGWYQDGAWFFTNVQERVFSSAAFPEMNSTNFYRASFTETPEEIESEIKISAIKSNDFRDMNRAQLSIREILDYKNLHAEAISPMLETKLHARLAGPLTSLVVVLIALPFGAVTGRRNVFVGVASSIVICFAYFVLMQLAVAIGTNGSVPPWIAAWSPNVLFGLVGIGLTWRVR